VSDNDLIAHNRYAYELIVHLLAYVWLHFIERVTHAEHSMVATCNYETETFTWIVILFQHKHIPD